MSRNYGGCSRGLANPDLLQAWVSRILQARNLPECPRECARKRGCPRWCPTGCFWGLLGPGLCMGHKVSQECPPVPPKERCPGHSSSRRCGHSVGSRMTPLSRTKKNTSQPSPKRFCYSILPYGPSELALHNLLVWRGRFGSPRTSRDEALTW